MIIRTRPTDNEIRKHDLFTSTKSQSILCPRSLTGHRGCALRYRNKVRSCIFPFFAGGYYIDNPCKEGLLFHNVAIAGWAPYIELARTSEIHLLFTPSIEAQPRSYLVYSVYKISSVNVHIMPEKSDGCLPPASRSSPRHHVASRSPHYATWYHFSGP